jgi:hypothetical protein
MRGRPKRWKWSLFGLFRSRRNVPSRRRRLRLQTLERRELLAGLAAEAAVDSPSNQEPSAIHDSGWSHYWKSDALFAEGECVPPYIADCMPGSGPGGGARERNGKRFRRRKQFGQRVRRRKQFGQRLGNREQFGQRLGEQFRERFGK